MLFIPDAYKLKVLYTKGVHSEIEKNCAIKITTEERPTPVKHLVQILPAMMIDDTT